jgi:serine/threonine-protein kinase HipA
LRLWCKTAPCLPVAWFGHAAGAYFLEYDAGWLAAKGAIELAPQFALQVAAYRGDVVKMFFENLLPEGQALDDVLTAIARSHALNKPSTLEQLGVLGPDLPGAFCLLPEGLSPPAAQAAAALSYATLSEQLRNRSSSPLLLGGGEARMSLAGAQDKVGVQFDPVGKQLFAPSLGTPSTHILKPDSRQPRYQPSAMNEYACMKLARALKLPVPDVWLLRVPEALLVVQRYDRSTVQDGSAVRITATHQIDGCQLLGHGSGWKYERQAALVTLPKLCAALRSSRVPAQDMLHFQHWVLFNYLIGNSDAHGKNLSLTSRFEGVKTQYRLAPFYDLLCVKAYGDNSLALYIGDEHQFSAVGLHSWEAWCADCGFSVKETLRGLKAFHAKFLPAWQRLLAQIASESGVTDAERTLLHNMTAIFVQHSADFAQMTGA